MVDILLVDDHELVRTALVRLLNDVPGIHVYEQVGSGEAAIEAVRRRMPDVVLMDVSMPGMGGIEATRRLTQIFPSIRVIVLTAHTDAPYPTQLMRAGAVGYLSKDCSVDEMVLAIRAVERGERHISSGIAQSLALLSLAPESSSPFEKLSQRELQVLMMVMQGDKTADISQKLRLSPKTISTYRARLHEKLQVRNDAELSRLAMRHGLFTEGS